MISVTKEFSFHTPTNLLASSAQLDAHGNNNKTAMNDRNILPSLCLNRKSRLPPMGVPDEATRGFSKCRRTPKWNLPWQWRFQAVNVRVGCAPCKGGAFQWVQAPPGNRSSRKQSEQSWRRRGGAGDAVGHPGEFAGLALSPARSP